MKKSVMLSALLILLSGILWAEMPPVQGQWRNLSFSGEEQIVSSEFHIRSMTEQERGIFGLEYESMDKTLIVEEVQKYFILNASYQLELQDIFRVTYNAMVIHDGSRSQDILVLFRDERPSMFYIIGPEQMLSTMENSLDGSMLKQKYTRF